MSGKLVREKIPQIIRQHGEEPTTRILSRDEYLEALDRKLEEEVAEYQADKDLEELADVIEVIQAIIIARGGTLHQIETERLRKRNERGGFDNRIYLDSE